MLFARASRPLRTVALREDGRYPQGHLLPREFVVVGGWLCIYREKWAEAVAVGWVLLVTVAMLARLP